jgi:hypothetical protein
MTKKTFVAPELKPESTLTMQEGSGEVILPS